MNPQNFSLTTRYLWYKQKIQIRYEKEEYNTT